MARPVRACPSDRRRKGPVIDGREAAVEEPLPLGWWLAVVAAIFLGAAAIVAWLGVTPLDRAQQLPLVTHLARGDLVHAFDGTRPVQTSGPGFGIFAVALYGPLRLVRSPAQAYDLISASTLVLLAIAVIAASRAAGVVARGERELVNLAAVILGVPILACFSEAFHPADVLALAAVLGAFVALQRDRRMWAILLIGFALLTRQWAVIPLVVLAALLPRRDGVRFAIGGLALAAVLLVPFLVADAGSTLDALRADVVVNGGLSASGLISMGDGGRYVVSRVLPLVVVGLGCTWLRWRRVPFTAPIAIAALAAALLVRPLLDPAGFIYYLAPGYAFAVLIEPHTRRWPVGGLVLGWLLWMRAGLSDALPAQVDIVVDGHRNVTAAGVVLSVATTLVVLIPAALAAREVVRLAAMERRRGEPGRDGSGAEAASGGPGHAEAGDGLLG